MPFDPSLLHVGKTDKKVLAQWLDPLLFFRFILIHFQNSHEGFLLDCVIHKVFLISIHHYKSYYTNFHIKQEPII